MAGQYRFGHEVMYDQLFGQVHYSGIQTLIQHSYTGKTYLVQAQDYCYLSLGQLSHVCRNRHHQELVEGYRIGVELVYKLRRQKKNIL